MALRCLLVGLVASLGFELPSGQDVTSWTRFGRDWVASRTISLADLQAGAPSWLGGGDPASQQPTASALVATPAPETPVEAVLDDLAFAAINEAMACSFVADFETARAEASATAPAEPAPAAAAEEVAIVEPGSEPELGSMALAHAEPEPLPPGDPAGSATGPEATPGGRLNQAVRATRQAMDAWTSLVQAVGREVVAR